MSLTIAPNIAQIFNQAFCILIDAAMGYILIVAVVVGGRRTN